MTVCTACVARYSECDQRWPATSAGDIAAGTVFPPAPVVAVHGVQARQPCHAVPVRGAPDVQPQVVTGLLAVAAAIYVLGSIAVLDPAAAPPTTYASSLVGACLVAG